MLPIWALAATVASILGVMVWRLWLRDQVRGVVREEVSDMRIAIAAVAGGFSLPDSTRARLRDEYGYGPRRGP